jgi:hypothetical protein
MPGTRRTLGGKERPCGQRLRHHHQQLKADDRHWIGLDDNGHSRLVLGSEVSATRRNFGKGEGEQNRRTGDVRLFWDGSSRTTDDLQLALGI